MRVALYFVLLFIGLPTILILLDLHLRKKQKRTVLEAAERVEVKPKDIDIKEVAGNVSVDKPSVRIPKPPQEGSAIIRPTSTVNVNVNIKKN